MSKRGWIIVSIAGGAAAVLIATSAGFATYVHRARKAAAATARETFDPYYSLVQYLRSLDNGDSGPNGA
ncbi:hypothetical protein BH23CHL2_BH23CHL2_16480 [soil metagenome]